MLRQTFFASRRVCYAFCKVFGNREFSISATNKMRLLQFKYQDKQKVGIELKDGGDVINLTDADPQFPDNMVAFLEKGESLLNAARKYSGAQSHIITRSEIKLLSPVTRPDKIICVGMNYKDHCLEQNAPIPEEPIIFSKFPSCIIASGDPIVLPKISDSVDWEVELAVVIGKRGKNIEESEAMDYVAGYTVAHDVSARDWQMQKNGKQWLLGKTFDTFCPLGPVIVTKDALPNPHKLALCCLVNNFPMQDSSTDQLIFKTEEIIAWVSQFSTLEPGDLILTGTPPGVGVFRKPPVYMKPGDVITCEVEGIGRITNTVVAEE
ncbi:oxaloacetate tautomerase fahd2, mitochondrial-like [Styela clava]